MVTPRFEPKQVIGDAVEILGRLPSASQDVAEASVLKVAYGALCENAGLSAGSHPRVSFRLHQSGLLGKASVDHREYRNCDIDFAWPEKRVGLRVTSWPRLRSTERYGGVISTERYGGVIPDFVYADAFLREQGWLVFQVDPASNTFDVQLDRAIVQIKRIGQYPRRTS
jgi:hypothetical protein